MTDTGTQTSSPRLDVGEGDHERFAHYVTPPSEITRAMVTGEPCTALCGKTWVPSRDPKNFPVCPTCKEIAAERHGRGSD